MKAPTNVYGPNGTLCKKGEPIPADWFDELPDLQAHLDNIERAPDPDEPVPARATVTEDESQTVRAKATLGRKRGQS